MILDKGNMILNETIWDFFFYRGQEVERGEGGNPPVPGFSEAE